MALSNAEAASKSKSAFLMSMSHDLRTPMNAIIGYSGFLEKCNLNDEERRYLNNIKVSGRQLMSLLNSVLSMTRIESGKLKLEKESHDLYEIFDDINIIIKERADEKNVSFSYETQGSDYTLFLDRAKYTEVLLNILSNAVKYTDKGGRVVMRNCIISNADGAVTVKSVIEDNGVGMSPSFLPHIFDSFERESLPGTGKEDGYGLGMSITKALVSLMGGEINVESIQGVGTTVMVSIPFEISKDKEKNEEVIEHKWNGKKALLVEDNDLNAEIAEIMLSDLGFDVIRAENGEVALSKLKEATEVFSIIFMDILMPVLDGYEATKRIREMEGERIPIVAMTANAFTEDKIKAIESGMDDHVQKPLEKDSLIKVIIRVLGE